MGRAVHFPLRTYRSVLNVSVDWNGKDSSGSAELARCGCSHRVAGEGHGVNPCFLCNMRLAATSVITTPLTALPHARSFSSF